MKQMGRSQRTAIRPYEILCCTWMGAYMSHHPGVLLDSYERREWGKALSWRTAVGQRCETLCCT